MVHDLRYALRTARRNPGFVLVAVGTMALGIGTNTAIFSLISGVLLRPLPFAHPDRLVQLNEFDPRNGLMPVAYPDLQDWRHQSTVLEAAAAYGNTSKDLRSGGDPERIAAVWGEPALFTTLGVPAVVGRTF